MENPKFSNNIRKHRITAYELTFHCSFSGARQRQLIPMLLGFLSQITRGFAHKSTQTLSQKAGVSDARIQQDKTKNMTGKLSNNKTFQMILQYIPEKLE